MEFDQQNRITVNWSSPMTGCMFLLILFLAMVTFLVLALGDSSDMSSRGAYLARMLQSLSYNKIPIGAILVTGYLFWLAGQYGWRWADRWAIKATDSNILFHRSLRLPSLTWEQLESLSLANVKRSWVTESNKSLCVIYRIDRTSSTQRKVLKGIDWESPEGQRFIEQAQEKDKMQ